jgi:hypothetical protein
MYNEIQKLMKRVRITPRKNAVMILTVSIFSKPYPHKLISTDNPMPFPIT